MVTRYCVRSKLVVMVTIDLVLEVGKLVVMVTRYCVRSKLVVMVTIDLLFEVNLLSW